jgi:serine protease Do
MTLKTFARVLGLTVCTFIVAAGGSPGMAAAQDRSATIRADGSSVFADVAEKVRPAVVFIRTERSANAERGQQGEAPFDFFREFFPDGDQRQRGRRIPGGGSGFIFDDEGRILTNYHVIRDADKITVLLDHNDGDDNEDAEEFDAHVVGFDRHTDIAIIQVDGAKNLPKVKLGNSDAMRVGDWVMAIGTPHVCVACVCVVVREFGSRPSPSQ